METAAEKYIRNRQAYREKAAAEFLASRPGTDRVLASVNELVAGLVLFVGGRDLRNIPKGLYIGDLLVSFCRSHFIAAELLLQGELIEAATLLRKQMELVARLHELGSPVDVAQLIGATPNVRHLREDLRRMYSEYSEIAHSSHPRSLEFLGTIEDGGHEYTPLYPVFHANLYSALSHLVLTAAEFFRWTTRFYETRFDDYVPDRDRSALEALVTAFGEVFPASRTR